MNLPAVPPWRAIYDRIAPFLALLILLIAMGAGVATYVNDQNDRERDRAITSVNTQRIADQTRLLACFDKFATALAGGLPPVREASAARDVALRRALGSLRDGLSKAVTGTVTPQDVRGIVREFQAYEAASDQLEQVRADNPYPEAPSEFCSTTQP